MLSRIEQIVRRPGAVVALVGTMAGFMAALGGGPVLATLWAVPTCFSLDLLRRLRPWLYLSLGRAELAVAASRSLLREGPTPAAAGALRLVAAAALLRQRKTAAAKSVLAQVDPAHLGAGALPGFLLMTGTVAARIGDAHGTAELAEAAASAAEAAGSTVAWAAAENLRAVAAILDGRPGEAAVRLEALERDQGVLGELAAVVRNNRAWAELRRGGDAARALEWARLAVRDWPDEPVLRGTLGAATLAAGGDPGEARRHLAQAVAVAEDVPPQERRVLLEFARKAAAATGNHREAKLLGRRIADIPGGGERVDALPPRPGAAGGA